MLVLIYRLAVWLASAKRDFGSMKEAFLVDENNGKTYDLWEPRWCSEKKTPLSFSKTEGITPQSINNSVRSIWRYEKVFPCKIPNPVSLGEGCTPLVPYRYRGIKALFKLEWFSPTGSFKDRGASAMMSFLKHQDIQEVVEDSSGNGGAAIAAYGAAAGISVNIVAPSNASPPKIAQIRSYGAKIHLIPGTRAKAEQAALEMAKNIFYASHNWHPFFLQGTKTLGYELWEDLGFRAPDNIIIPTGAGSNVLGCYMAFMELLEAKQILKLPKIFVVQPKNCCPIVACWQDGMQALDSLIVTKTIAEGTAINKPIRLTKVLDILKKTNGGGLAVTEEEILEATFELSRSGFFVEPTCASAAVGLEKLRAKNLIGSDETTVVVLTGSGLKSSGFFIENGELRQ